MVSFRGPKKAWATPRSVSFRGLIQNCQQATAPLSYAVPPQAQILLHVLRRMQYFTMTDQVRTRFYVSLVFTCEKVHIRIFSSYFFYANQTYHVLCNCKSSPSCPKN